MRPQQETTDDVRASDARIGPGRLVLVVGPSGAGKDTVLTLLRAATRESDRIVFPRRVITRAPGEAEDHDSLAPVAFERAAADGAFAVWWSAHGNHYGIPASAEQAVRAGQIVVCNVSRTVVAPLRQRYAFVTVALITAPSDVLEQRLANRRRSSDGALASRIARSSNPECTVDADVTINNVGKATLAAATLLEAIRSANAAKAS